MNYSGKVISTMVNTSICAILALFRPFRTEKAKMGVREANYYDFIRTYPDRYVYIYSIRVRPYEIITIEEGLSNFRYEGDVNRT